jgi:uncharacterized membrane protein
MAQKQLVLAFFNGEAAADAAVAALKEWDKASKEIKLGSIGILVKDDEGKIKTQKLGARHTKTGVVVGAIAGILSGGISVIGGAIVGGIAGAFFHKGLGLSKEDLARIDGELDGGRAAVAVLAEADEASAVAAKLAESGGQPETYEVTEEAIEEATAATEAAAESAEEAAPAESEESA